MILLTTVEKVRQLLKNQKNLEKTNCNLPKTAWQVFRVTNLTSKAIEVNGVKILATEVSDVGS